MKTKKAAWFVRFVVFEAMGTFANIIEKSDTWNWLLLGLYSEQVLSASWLGMPNARAKVWHYRWKNSCIIRQEHPPKPGFVGCIVQHFVIQYKSPMLVDLTFFLPQTEFADSVELAGFQIFLFWEVIKSKKVVKTGSRLFLSSLMLLM